MSYYDDGLALLANRGSFNKKALDKMLAKDLPVDLILLDGSKITITREDVEYLGQLIEELGRKIAWRFWRGKAQRAAQVSKNAFFRTRTGGVVYVTKDTIRNGEPVLTHGLFGDAIYLINRFKDKTKTPIWNGEELYEVEADDNTEVLQIPVVVLQDDTRTPVLLAEIEDDLILLAPKKSDFKNYRSMKYVGATGWLLYEDLADFIDQLGYEGFYIEFAKGRGYVLALTKRGKNRVRFIDED